MRPQLRVDFPLLLSVLVLMGLGVVLVYSSSWVLAGENYNDVLFFAKRQALFAVVGLVALTVGVMVDPRLYQRMAYPLLAVTFVLLVAVLIPGVGPKIGLARRWISIGPFNLQAAEIAKFVLIVVLAKSIAKKGPEQMRSFSVGVLPHALVAGAVLLFLLLQPDFGTAVMLGSVSVILVFVGGVRIRYILAGVLGAVPVAALLIASSPYRMRRVLAFLDPWAHRYDIGYQVTESLMTLGSGGFFGAGLGDGRQKMFFLPAAHTDFIFSVLGEEMGFLGVLLVVCAFSVIMVRGMRAAMVHPNAFSALVALGLTSLLVLQASFNIAVALGLVPTKGLTLPFLSYGGSSLIVSAFIGGVLLRLSGEAQVDHDLEEQA